MRISDWSSDVCSSDLTAARAARITPAVAKGRPSKNPPALPPRFLPSVVWERLRAIIKQVAAALNRSKVLLPGDRKSVGSGKSVSVRVDQGGRRIIKKKTTCN